MKASFSITNAFLSGLKLLPKRRRDFRSFASANLALSWSNSSEDEVSEAEQPLFLSQCSVGHTDSGSIIRCNSNHLSKVRNSFFNCQPVNQCTSELELVKSILRKEGWNLESPHLNGDKLDESVVIKGLNDLFNFKSGANANLALCLFSYLESGLGFKHTVRSICTMAYILICGYMNYKAVELVTRLVRETKSNDAQHDLVLKVLQEICVLRYVLKTLCSMVVKCYVEENLPKVAISLVHDMTHFGCFPSVEVCGILLKSLLLFDEEDVAWDLLEKMQSRELVNPSIISLFIRDNCRKGIPERAWRLLIAMRGHGVEPDVVSFTILIDYLCKISHLREAFMFLFKMIGLGISPDPVSLSCIVDGFCKMGKREEVVHFLNFFNVPLDLYVYNSVLSMLCRAGDMLHASNVFQDMLGLGFLPDCFSFTTMIDGYCKAKDINKVDQFLARMFKAGIHPSIATYTTLINSCCGSGNIDRAEFLLMEMTSKGIVPDIVVYNTIINGYGKNGQLHKVNELLDSMKAFGVSPDTVTYNSLIHGLVVSGSLREAKNITERGSSADIITFTSVIGGFSARGDFEGAKLVWAVISKLGLKPDLIACSSLLNGYCKAHNMEEAMELFKRMTDSGLVPDLVLYNTMIQGSCSVRDVKNACQLLEMMVRQGVLPNVVTVRALAHGYWKNKVAYPVETALNKLRGIFWRKLDCSTNAVFHRPFLSVGDICMLIGKCKSYTRCGLNIMLRSDLSLGVVL